MPNVHEEDRITIRAFFTIERYWPNTYTYLCATEELVFNSVRRLNFSLADTYEHNLRCVPISADVRLCVLKCCLNNMPEICRHLHGKQELRARTSKSKRDDFLLPCFSAVSKQRRNARKNVEIKAGRLPPLIGEELQRGHLRRPRFLRKLRTRLNIELNFPPKH